MNTVFIFKQFFSSLVYSPVVKTNEVLFLMGNAVRIARNAYGFHFSLRCLLAVLDGFQSTGGGVTRQVTQLPRKVKRLCNASGNSSGEVGTKPCRSIPLQKYQSAGFVNSSFAEQDKAA